MNCSAWEEVLLAYILLYMPIIFVCLAGMSRAGGAHWIGHLYTGADSQSNWYILIAV